jgi:hypothetical protein
MNHRKLLVATAIVASAAITACSDMTVPTKPPSEGLPLASSEGRSLQLTKECSEYTGQAGDHCTVIKSNVQQIPAGSTVTYLEDADLVNLTFDGDVVLRAAPADAAFGHCIVTDLVKAIGNCEFSSGSGNLSGFRASVVVSGDRDPLLAHWKGWFSLNQGD